MPDITTDSALAAYHAGKAGRYRAAQLAALKRGAPEYVCRELGDRWRQHRDQYHACHLRTSRTLDD